MKDYLPKAEQIPPGQLCLGRVLAMDNNCPNPGMSSEPTGEGTSAVTFEYPCLLKNIWSALGVQRRKWFGGKSESPLAP